MARFTAAWTDTDLTEWQAGDGVRETTFKEQVGQNIEFLGQSHDHSGDSGDGGTLQTADPKAIWFYGQYDGAPFA